MRPAISFYLTTFILLLIIPGCGPTEDEIKTIVMDEMARMMQRTTLQVKEVGPYSAAVGVGGFLFISGQIGIDQISGILRSEDIEVETRQVMDNLMGILASAGLDSSNVVNTTVYLRDIGNYAKMNLIYGGYFAEGNYPSRTTVGVRDLPRNANVEISLIAYKYPGSK